MAAREFLLLVLTLACLLATSESATFENVDVVLTTRRTRLFVNGTSPVKNLRIKSDNRLSNSLVDQPLSDVRIENQIIPVLSRSSVANLPGIERIAIVRCGLKEIKPRAFWNLPRLEILQLNDNELEEIKNGVFNDLNLTIEHELNLANNKISKIGDRAFNNMLINSVTRIILDNNRISTWSSDWFAGTPANAISIAHNLLEELPPHFLGFYKQFKDDDRPLNFWYLIANDNKIKKVHVEAFQGIDDLSYLNLRNNFIDHLEPKVFNGVLEINNLVLINNSLSNIDEGLFKDIEVTYLSLQDNKLECVDPNITSFYKIYVEGNPITPECVQIWNDWTEEHENETVLELTGRLGSLD